MAHHLNFTVPNFPCPLRNVGVGNRVLSIMPGLIALPLQETLWSSDCGRVYLCQSGACSHIFIPKYSSYDSVIGKHEISQSLLDNRRSLSKRISTPKLDAL